MSRTNCLEKIREVSAFIIAGGKATRFGGDKLNYIYRGKPLIAHGAEILKNIFTDVAIVGDGAIRFKYLSLPYIEDIVRGVGPLAGIITALEYAQTERIFVVAGDMPLLNDQFVRYLVRISAGFDVTVPFVNGEYEPLHAVFSKNCAVAIRTAIGRGEKRIVSFFGEVRVRTVREEEIRAFDDPAKIFFNVNYPDDIQ
ncbi:MAG: molybdenum cofactor guanylyltransferase [Spirochaetes bacterium]|nr:molybdenum cofactor guanylyltransferase [Spirochaetota bacterium]